jgi:hypothetical protein
MAARYVLGTVLGGLVALILAGCEPVTPAAGNAPTEKPSIVGEWDVVILSHTDWVIPYRDEYEGRTVNMLKELKDQRGVQEVMFRIEAGGRATIECNPNLCGTTQADYVVHPAEEKVTFVITRLVPMTPEVEGFIGYAFHGTYYFSDRDTVEFKLDSSAGGVESLTTIAGTK